MVNHKDKFKLTAYMYNTIFKLNRRIDVTTYKKIYTWKKTEKNLRKNCPQKNGPRKKSPQKKGPLEKKSPWKKVPGNKVSGKMVPGKKSSRKIVLC